MAGGRIAGDRWRRALGRVLLATAVLAGGLPVSAAAAAVVVLTLRDAIGPATADYVVRGLAHAAERGAPLVVLELDTPGGLDTSTRTIVQAILASPVPVATWVSPSGARAASAGTYLLYASHVAAMAPATTVGAATPVAIGGPAPGRSPRDAPGADERDRPARAPGVAPADAMTAKQVNDAVAFIRGLAELHGRNADWAERAVREAVSLSADAALREQVVDLVVADRAGLLERLDGRTVRVGAASRVLDLGGRALDEHHPDRRNRILSVITHPGVALVLMMIGVYGLLFEFLSPGFGLPGIAGAICLLLGLTALQMLPFNAAGLALCLLGVGLLVAEVLTPAFGLLGIGGIVALAAGGLLLFDRDVPGMEVPWPVIGALALFGGAFVLTAGSAAMRLRRRPVAGGSGGVVGALGRVERVDGDTTWAQVRGERWRISADQPLAAGQTVRVTGRHGLELTVRPDPVADPRPIDRRNDS